MTSIKSFNRLSDGLKTVFVELEKRERNVRLIDPDCPENNTFHVTDELTFSSGTPPDIRTDITLFINGVVHRGSYDAAALLEALA